MSYPEHLLVVTVEEGVSYPSVEMQWAYFTAPTDWSYIIDVSNIAIVKYLYNR